MPLTRTPSGDRRIAGNLRHSWGPDRLNVLHVVPTFNIGGVESLLVAAASQWSYDRYRVGVCFLNAGPRLYVNELSKCGIDIYDIGTRWRGKVDLLTTRRLGALVAALGTHVIHTHTISAQVYGQAVRTWKRRVLVVSHQHRMPTALQLRVRPLRHLLGYPDMTIAVSHATQAAVVEELHAPPSRVRLVLNGIARSAAPAPGATDGMTIYTVGRLSQEKGLAVLLEAMAIVVRNVDAAKLAIVGDGAERDRLEQQVRELGLEQAVSFLGAHESPAAIVKPFDVFALPSFEEGLPLSLLEAMAAGKPVVATAVGGVPEVVTDGVSGRLVAPRNPAQMAAALLDVLQNPALRTTLSRGAQQVAERFDIQHTVHEIEHVYETLAERRLGLCFSEAAGRWMPRSIAQAGHAA